MSHRSMMSFTEFIKATSKRVKQLDILIISCIWKLVYLKCQITMNEPATTTRRDKLRVAHLYTLYTATVKHQIVLYVSV